MAVLEPLGITTEGLAETAATMMRQRQVLADAMTRLAADAREWGAVGMVSLSIDQLVRAVPDTALRLFADSLQRVSGARYRARFRSLEPLYRQLMAGERTDGTLSGCLLRRGGDVLMICREPGAIAPPLPLATGETEWDQRWRVSVSVPDGLLVGALGSEGQAALVGQLDAAALDEWEGLPAEVRIGTPAIWRDAGGGVCGDLIAVPHAGFVAAGTAHLGEIAVEHIHRP